MHRTNHIVNYKNSASLKSESPSDSSQLWKLKSGNISIFSPKFIKKRSQTGKSPGVIESSSRVQSPDLYQPKSKNSNKGKPPIIVKKNIFQALAFKKSIKNFESELKNSPKDLEKLNSDKSDCASIRDYNIDLIIGEGSFSIVRKAIKKPCGTIVAIKNYKKAMIKKKSINIYKEISIMKKLNHNNIVKLLDVVENDSEINLIMEYIPGISLYRYLKSQTETKIAENQAKLIFSQIFSAIDYLHSNNIAHCDLKLENILITDQNIIKIIDFGFSDHCDQKKKVFCGSSYYMTPEIVLLEDYYGDSADIWALGVILYTILTGTYPFKASNDPDLHEKIQKTQVKIPSFISPQGKKLISKMLKKESYNRPKIKDIINDPWNNYN